jgi:hypothetical protein
MWIQPKSINEFKPGMRVRLTDRVPSGSLEACYCSGYEGVVSSCDNNWVYVPRAKYFRAWERWDIWVDDPVPTPVTPEEKPEFKVGDTVRVVWSARARAENDYISLQPEKYAGKTGTVQAKTGSGNWLVKLVAGSELCFAPDCLQLVPIAQPEVCRPLVNARARELLDAPTVEGPLGTLWQQTRNIWHGPSLYEKAEATKGKHCRKCGLKTCMHDPAGYVEDRDQTSKSVRSMELTRDQWKCRMFAARYGASPAKIAKILRERDQG